MKKKRKTWLIILCVIAVVVIGFIIVNATKSSNKELVIRTHVVTQYTVENTVTATGTIEPVETVEVGTQVSGCFARFWHCSGMVNIDFRRSGTNTWTGSFRLIPSSSKR